jgi:hypothetical protein
MLCMPDDLEGEGHHLRVGMGGTCILFLVGDTCSTNKDNSGVVNDNIHLISPKKIKNK